MGDPGVELSSCLFPMLGEEEQGTAGKFKDFFGLFSCSSHFNLRGEKKGLEGDDEGCKGEERVEEGRTGDERFDECERVGEPGFLFSESDSSLSLVSDFKADACTWISSSKQNLV